MRKVLILLAVFIPGLLIAAPLVPSQSLGDYLMRLPSSQDAQQFYGLLIGATIGMFGHYVRRWATGDVAGSLWQYMFFDSPKNSALAALAVIAWCLGEVGTGLFVTDSGEFVGWGLIIMSGLKTGYAGDSLLNKGTKP